MMLFNQAAENNKQVILEQLLDLLANSSRLLEIGSGTGQHAVHFAANLPHLTWHTSDLRDNHLSINAYIDDSGLSNVHRPFEFDVGKNDWPELPIDAVYTANTAHIMQPHHVQRMMRLVADNLLIGGVFCQYGPFKVDGKFTTESNASFDASLRAQGFGGYSDIEELQDWCAESGLKLEKTIPMPANNFLLVWRKS